MTARLLTAGLITTTLTLAPTAAQAMAPTPEAMTAPQHAACVLDFTCWAESQGGRPVDPDDLDRLAEQDADRDWATCAIFGSWPDEVALCPDFIPLT